MSRQSRNELKPAFVLMALNTGDIQKEKQILDYMGFSANKQLRGYYKGTPEDSHLVLFKSPVQLQDLITIAKQYNQESILIVDSDRQAELYFCKSGRNEKLGLFKSVHEAVARKQDSYTFDESNGSYWLAV